MKGIRVILVVFLAILAAAEAALAILFALAFFQLITGLGGVDAPAGVDLPVTEASIGLALGLAALFGGLAWITTKAARRAWAKTRTGRPEGGPQQA